MQESNFNVIIDTENYNAVIGESAKIDVGQAINYIKSGKAEIQAAVNDGTAAFNLNATAKTNAFNQNATDKTTAFNNNANAKTQDFNDNAVAKTGDFDTNATNKTTAFNNNATAKTGDFNDNYTAKKGLIDAQVAVAEGAAALAKQWAIGDPSEPTGNSAKYWAEQASSSLSGLTSRVTAIEGKIPADASSSNQLADKDWVGNQGYITGITSGDVTTALGYTPYNSTNPDGYISGITSGDVTTALGYTPYDATNPNGYTSNIGTVTSVNNTSPDGSGNVTITIPNPLPSQTGNSGKFLTTDGTNPSWQNIDALPSQTGQAGKYLTTDGSSASWATLSVNPDNKSINKNASDQLQTIGVINQNDTTTALKSWTGTKAQYDAIVTKDANTRYDVDGYGVFIGDVQIAAGSSQLNNPFSLLDYKYSEYELSNASWLLSNGQYNSGATYSAVYNLLLAIYNGTTTKAGVSVKLSTEAYTDTDFVLNTSDTTFRLPLKVALASGKAVAGNGMTLGWTDGVNNYGTGSSSGGPLHTISLYGADVGTSSSGTGTGVAKCVGITTDETKSGIETSANGLYLYFYVGETVQDANIIAAAGVLTDVADLKAHSIVETYVNGTSWYRVYSDGWVEQGGENVPASTIAFYIPFKDTNYTLVGTITRKADSASNDYVAINSKTTTHFVWQSTDTSYIKNINWLACGYIS